MIRVWLSYKEVYREMYSDDHDVTAGRSQFYAEQQLGWKQKELSWTQKGKTCFVLTRDKDAADYQADVSVVRFMGGGNDYGEATLSVVRKGGDVLLTETFSQSSDRNAHYDIAAQPLDKVWDTFCGAGGVK